MRDSRSSRLLRGACALGLLAAAALMIAPAAAQQQQSCFFADGTAASGHTPCFTNTTVGGASDCCPPSDYCLGGGLCMKAGLTPARGSCTSAGDCISPCPNPRSGMAFIAFCSRSGSDVTYACSADDCGDGSDTAFTTNIRVHLRPTDIPSVLSSLDLTPTEYCASIAPAAAETQAVTSAAAANNAEASGSAADETTLTSSDQSRRYGATDMLGVGLGVGLPLLLALAAALFLLVRARRALALERAAGAGAPAGGGGGNGMQVDSQHQQYVQPAQPHAWHDVKMPVMGPGGGGGGGEYGRPLPPEPPYHGPGPNGGAYAELNG